MARSDLLITLVKAGVTGDRLGARNVAEAIIADERAKQHTVLADRLYKTLVANASQANAMMHLHGHQHRGTSDNGRSDVLAELEPRKRLDDLWLSEICRANVEQLVEEQRRAALLRAHGLDPRNRVLLVGPPGNGKTSLAEAIAEALAVPFFVVRYESLIGSYLGETAGKLKKAFDFARTTPCVLFFDEFDAIGKERGDIHETGEIKRVVSTFLMQADDLPAYTVIVAATNHAELLDRAVWRRFQLRLSLPPPSRKQMLSFIGQFLESLEERPATTAAAVAKRLGRLSYAEVEEFTLDVRRSMVLGLQARAAKAVIEQQLKLWERRAKPTKGEQLDDGETTSSEASDAD